MRLIKLLSTVAPLLAGLLPANTVAQSTPPTAATGSAASQLPASTAAPAILIADKIYISADNDGRRLIAEGNVEAFQGDTRLQARRITFEQESGRLDIEGPIRMDQGGEISILANAAEMDPDLQNGILRGARMVFQEQVQLAALQMTRADGRYTQLYKTAITSCDVCDDGRPPLWQIRAERITHDQQERQLYLESAQLRVLDTPVFYFPALRVPDPTLDRATGFLVPSVVSTTNFGTGIKVPYFIKMGDHRDLTVTPYLSEETRTIELRYRQAFRNGDIEIETGLSRDNVQPDDDRGYLFANGRFDLKRGYQLSFNIETVSDDGYLADYDISDKDRLRSDVTLTKINRDKLVRASFIRFKSLRDSEDQDFVPTNIVYGVYEKRLFPTRLGGELRFGLDILDFTRTSSTPADATNANGRDVSRISADVDYRRSWNLPMGIQSSWIAGFGIDSVAVADDAVLDPEATQFTPYTALTFRLPMARRTTRGATQVLEPILQIGWRDVSGDEIPNEASNISEFDQGNLLSLSRFPEDDAREDGLSLVYGLNWSHFARDGKQASFSVGQILRDDDPQGFTATSGLDRSSSSFLLAGQFRMNNALALTARGLLDTDLSVSKAEVRGEWHADRVDLKGSYLWLQADSEEDRDSETAELWLDGTYQLDSAWSAAANLRYDVNDGRATRAGLGFEYSNECVTLNLSVNRRYTSTTSVEPQTDFGFTLSLNGFSVKTGNKSQRRSCSIS